MNLYCLFLRTNVYIAFALLSMTFSFEGRAQVVINEVSAFKGAFDEVGDESDWIELINTSNNTIDLTGFHLSDDANEWDKWTVPELQLLPGEISLILASDEDKTYHAENWQSLIVDTDEWTYLPAYFEPPANWNYESFNDQTWSTGMGGFGYADGDDNTQIISTEIYYLRKTFDLESLEGMRYLLFHADYDDGFIAYLNGVEIARSETMIGNSGAFDSYATGTHEALLYQGLVPEHWLFDIDQIENLLHEGENVLAVQVHNSSALSSDLSGRFFLSISAEENAFDLPVAPSWIPEIYSPYHTNFKLSPGEPLILSDAEGNLIDFIDIDPNLSNGLTVGRTDNGLGVICVFDTPTPWYSNEDSWCYEGIEPTPTISLASGWYDGPQTAVATATSETQNLHYSTNGDLPTTGHPLYNAPISINASSVLSVRAFSTGNKLPSKSADVTCIINEDNHELPVFSVITDSLNLWDYNEGIYVLGPNAQEDIPYFGSNFWEPWSKWSRLEYFDAGQQLQAKGEFDLEIHGGWSRAEPQKSFRFDFKSIYTGPLNYPIFSQKPFIQEVGNLNIRNGGQHVVSDKIQDAVFSRVASKTNVHNMAYEPCLLYLNGAYWGIYGIREKIDEEYVEANFDIDEDDVDLLNSWEALAGTGSDFIETYILLMSADPQQDEYYSILSSKFNLNNYIDYFAIETYVQNLDWMGILWGLNNVKLWRSQQGGKWSYVLYDTDASFGYFGGQPSDNYLQFARSPLFPNAHSILFDRNLENEQFRCDFGNRYADLMNTVFQPVEFDADVNALKGFISDAIPDHVERWESPYSVEFWDTSVEQIKNYNTLRLPSARNHVNATLGFNGQVSVTLDVVPAGAGTIQISTISPDEYPWQGVYFNGCPVNISVTPNEGYAFEYWEDSPFIDETDQTNDSLTVDIGWTAQFIAHFTQCNVDAEVTISAQSNELSFTAEGIDGLDEIIWYMNGEVVGNGETMVASQTGIYSVTITSGNCTYTSETFDFIYVGIETRDREVLSVWPNPAKDQVQLTSPNIDMNNAILEIWSVSGQLVLREARPQGPISVSHLAEGVYQLRLTDGKQSEVVRLVVE